MGQMKEMTLPDETGFGEWVEQHPKTEKEVVKQNEQNGHSASRSEVVYKSSEKGDSKWL